MNVSDSSIDQVYTRRVRRRVYDRDFKLRVVQQVTKGLQAAKVARDLGVSRSIVSRWMRESQSNATHAFRGNGRRLPSHAKLERLRRENEKLRAERDLLKKASARFVLIPNSHSDSLQSIEQCGR